jgi:hypothetical protein
MFIFGPERASIERRRLIHLLIAIQVIQCTSTPAHDQQHYDAQEMKICIIIKTFLSAMGIGRANVELWVNAER